MSSTINRIAARLSKIQAMDTSYSMGSRDIADDISWVANRMKKAHGLKIIKTGQKGVQLLTFTLSEVPNAYYVGVAELDPVTNEHHLLGFVKFAQEKFGKEGKRSQQLLTPHSTFSEAAQGKGYASSIYKWALDRGVCFMSSGTQSEAANVLWSKLGRTYPWFLVADKDRTDLQFMGQGDGLSRSELKSYNTRLVLLGKGWDLEKFLKKFNVTEYSGGTGDADDEDDDDWGADDEPPRFRRMSRIPIRPGGRIPPRPSRGGSPYRRGGRAY